MTEEVKARLELLHRVAPDSIGDQLRLEVLECEGDTYLLRGKTQAWMRNAHGVLHGGMGATVADQAMGAVAYCYKAGEGIAPTIEMHVNYHRPPDSGGGCADSGEGGVCQQDPDSHGVRAVSGQRPGEGVYYRQRHLFL